MSKSLSAIPPSLWRDPPSIVALGFGAGALPVAPGTWGTLAAVPFYLLLQQLSLPAYLITVLVLFGIGVWCCGRAARLSGVHDHSAIVWDEMVGYWISMAAAPVGGWWWLGGFFLFRLFDIWKPWPIRALDRGVSGGLGIMVDDVLAGIYAAVCLFIVKVVFFAG